MAATRPDKTLEWATRAGASVIEPPSAKRLDGWVGGEEPPASWFNWWMKLAWEWVTYLEVHDDEREAERRDINVISNARLMTAAAYFTGVTPKEPTASGIVVGSVDYQVPRYVVFWTDGSYAYSSDGHVWAAGAVVHANCDWLSSFANGTMFIVVGPGGTIYTAGATSVTSWTKRTPADATAEFLHALYVTPANRLILATGNHHVQTSDDLGATWAKRTFPGADFVAIQKLAVNPAGVIVGVGLGLTDAMSVRSLDNGVTWEVSAIVYGSGTMVDVLWSERRQAWFAVGSHDLYTSTDGLTWTQLAAGVNANRIFELERVIAAYPSSYASPVRGLYAHAVRDTGDPLRMPMAGGAGSSFVASRLEYAGHSAIWTWYRAITGGTEWVTVSDWIAPPEPPP